MSSQLVKSESKFSFHLDGDSTVDAKLLADIISDLSELTELAARIEDPDVFLKLRITAFRNGSFQVDFSAICEMAENLSAHLPEAASFALSVIGIVKGFFEIKKHLKGTDAKSVKENPADRSKVHIENNQGVVICVEKSSAIILENARADEITSEIVHRVLQNNKEKGFSIHTDKGSFVCPSQELEDTSLAIPSARTTLTKTYTVSADLIIKKAALIGMSAWEFYYRDKSISATILDTDFLDELHRGKYAIHSGDFISAELQISVDVDNELKPVGKEKFVITKIHGGIQKDNNTKLDGI